jgi:hypothetical protein
MLRSAFLRRAALAAAACAFIDVPWPKDEVWNEPAGFITFKGDASGEEGPWQVQWKTVEAETWTDHCEPVMGTRDFVITGLAAGTYEFRYKQA